MLAPQVFNLKCVITAKSQKMKHKSIHNDLIFYLEGELSSDRNQEISEHLATCSECRQFAEVLKASFSIIEKEKSQEQNPFFYQALKAKIENRKQPEKIVGFQRILQPVLFSVLIIAGISFGILMGAKITNTDYSSGSSNEMYYFNEMGSEPIESYFLN